MTTKWGYYIVYVYYGPRGSTNPPILNLDFFQARLQVHVCSDFSLVGWTRFRAKCQGHPIVRVQIYDLRYLPSLKELFFSCMQYHARSFQKQCCIINLVSQQIYPKTALFKSYRAISQLMMKLYIFAALHFFQCLIYGLAVLYHILGFGMPASTQNDLMKILNNKTWELAKIKGRHKSPCTMPSSYRLTRGYKTSHVRTPCLFYRFIIEADRLALSSKNPGACKNRIRPRFIA